MILDEPTNGLDPVGMQDVRTLIRAISDGGRTVIVSSHLLGELEQVCDWLIVLDHGGLVHLGTPESLGGTSDTLVLRPDAERLDDLAVIAGSSGLPIDASPDQVVLTRSTGSTPTASPLRSTGVLTPLGSSSPSCTTSGPTSRPATSNSSTATSSMEARMIDTFRSEWILLNRRRCGSSPA